MFGGFVQPEFDPGPKLRAFVAGFRGDEDLCPGSVEGLGQHLADPVEPGPRDTTTDNGGNMIFVNNGVDQDFRANPFGPVNARYVCFQRKRSIVAVDPVSGEPLWVRQDIPSGSEVFGDEQYLFVLPPGSDEASVYRAIDGELLGTRKCPGPSPTRTPDYGNSVGVRARGQFGVGQHGIRFLGPLCAYLGSRAADNRTGRGRVLALFDPWQQKAVWPSRNFAAGARVSVVGSEAVGVLEPGGHFVLVALADGRTIADVKLEVRPHFSVTDLVVTRMGDQYIVLAHDNRTQGNGNEDQAMQPLQGMSCYPLRRARIYALDLQGKLAWPAPVDIDHQHFLLSQPGQLPVLLFAAFHYDNRGGRPNTCGPRWWQSIAATAASFTTRICGPHARMGWKSAATRRKRPCGSRPITRPST